MIPRLQQFLTSLGTLGFLMTAGCQGEPSASSSKGAGNSAVATATAIADPGPSVVELQKVDAIVDREGIVRLQIHYKFTSGAPTRHYLCKIRFPDIDRTIAKFMSAGELSREGAFKAAIEAGETPPESYEVVLSEAESPDAGFDPISNTLTGAFQKPATAEIRAP